MQTVVVPALNPELLLEELGEVRLRRLQQIGETVRHTMGTHMQLHVNSTAAGELGWPGDAMSGRPTRTPTPSGPGRSCALSPGDSDHRQPAKLPARLQLIVQVSRWDPLKDMAGVMEAFARYAYPHNDSHLVLAGPNVSVVADDPEGAEVLKECMAAWTQLPAAVRRRVHPSCLPMLDPDENGLLVNALQRAASVVTQKSLAEGFGFRVSHLRLAGGASAR